MHLAKCKQHDLLVKHNRTKAEVVSSARLQALLGWPEYTRLVRSGQLRYHPYGGWRPESVEKVLR